MTQNGFSVLTACYNTGEYLRECLDSILNQNYPRDRFELICIDDGSTDNSPAIIRSFTSQTGFVTRRTSNQGLEATSNFAISLSKYGWIVRVDADDVLDREFLRTMDEAIRRWPDADFYYCKDYTEYYTEKEHYSKTLPDFDPEEVFARGDFFATGTVFKKADLQAVGCYDERVKNCGLENYHLVLRLISRGNKGRAVPGASFKYRRHRENMSIVKLNSIIAYGHGLLRQYGREFMTNEHHPYNLKLR